MQKYAIFTIGDETFGIGIDRIVEILKVQKIFTIPGLPEFLSGVMNTRGMVIPILDLRLRFGVTPVRRKQERIILVRYGKERVGFLVDGIREILSFRKEDIKPAPGVIRGFRTEYLTGLGRKGDEIIILLNVDTLLTSEERIKLEKSFELLEGTGAATDHTAQ